jgi:hypothetical protein
MSATALRCGPEVASAFWIPVGELWDAKNLDHLALGDNRENAWGQAFPLHRRMRLCGYNARGIVSTV